MADIFPTDERSPESLKRRVDHLKDMNVKELSRWILSYAVIFVKTRSSALNDTRFILQMERVFRVLKSGSIIKRDTYELSK